MEVYILDSLYRRSQVIDDFDSLIWTERFSALGDFQLAVHSTLRNRSRFVSGTRLAMNDSYRVMTVETVEDGTDSEGRNILKLSGSSLEKILDDRAALASLTDLTVNAKWNLAGYPADVARYIFHTICVTGALNAGDIIAGVTEGSIFPADTTPEPSDSVSIQLDPTTVYEALKQICEMYNMGFRLVRDINSSQLYFDIYMGSNRTTGQTTLPAVVFSPFFDNLQKTTELASIAAYKNVAYVISPVGHEVVYAAGVDPTSAGFDRRVVLVKADDITDTIPATASDKMIQRGYEALAKARQFAGFDGEISQNSNFKYGVDYNLGDIVEIRNVDGATTNMQVTEQIFVSDSEGERSYPTLSVNKFITAGSWSAWDYNQVWNDLDLDPTAWADQP